MKSAYSALVSKVEEIRGSGKNYITGMTMCMNTVRELKSYPGIDMDMTPNGKYPTHCFGIPVVVKTDNTKKSIIIDYIKGGIKLSTAVYHE